MGIFKHFKRQIKQKRAWRVAVANNIIQIPKSKNINLNIIGKNNKIIINGRPRNGKIDIQIYGDNNTVTLGAGLIVSDKLSIIIGNSNANFAPAYNCEFSIGEKVSVESMTYCTFNSGAWCHIGAYCMFSYGINIFNTDGHPVFDLQTQKIINWVNGVEIGEHTWVGAYAKILKNTVLPDNSIVGYGAVVAGKFTEPHTAIAGNPARVVRKNISWDSFAYEYCQNNLIKSPHVVSINETIQELIKSNKSICRFGDGEFDIMFDHVDLPFQKYDERLCQKLWDAWKSNTDNLMIATNGFYFKPVMDYKSDFLHGYLRKRRHQLQEISDVNRVYYAADITCVYKTRAEQIDYARYYNSIRGIWKNKDVVLVHGEGIFDKLKYNIFDSAKSIESVLVSARNAFDEYDDTLKKLLSMDKNKVYILICGPVATAMAHDLSKCGVRAMDLGHIAKDYDWFRRGINPDGAGATKAFFDPD